jgi:hypothetical protein
MIFFGGYTAAPKLSHGAYYMGCMRDDCKEISAINYYDTMWHGRISFPLFFVGWSSWGVANHMERMERRAREKRKKQL